MNGMKLPTYPGRKYHGRFNLLHVLPLCLKVDVQEHSACNLLKVDLVGCTPMNDSIDDIAFEMMLDWCKQRQKIR